MNAPPLNGRRNEAAHQIVRGDGFALGRWSGKIKMNKLVSTRQAVDMHGGEMEIQSVNASWDGDGMNKRSGRVAGRPDQDHAEHAVRPISEQHTFAVGGSTEAGSGKCMHLACR